MMRRLLFILIAAVAGCSNQGDPCVSDNDCFRGEACVEGFCGDPVAVIDSNNENDDTGGGADATDRTDMGAGDRPDMNVTPPDGGDDDMTTPIDMGDDDTGNNMSGVCIVDPFTSMCPSDDNDSFADYITMESGRGCLSGGDNFEGGMVEVTDHVICPLESGDKFSTNLLPCDNITYFVEVTVTPEQPCDPDDWDLNVRLQGNDCIEGNGKMLCEDLADGSKRAIGWLEPSNSVTSPFIDITPIADNLRFDYTLKLVTRE